jgi:hypothetical protein
MHVGAAMVTSVATLTAIIISKDTQLIENGGFQRLLTVLSGGCMVEVLAALGAMANVAGRRAELESIEQISRLES